MSASSRSAPATPPRLYWFLKRRSTTSSAPRAFWSILLSCGALAALTGCFDDDARTPTSGADFQENGESIRWTASTLPDDSIFGDAPQMEVAWRVPEFSGFYYAESGSDRIVVAMTDPARGDEAQQRVVDQLQGHGRTRAASPAGGFEVRQAAYPFLELARYRTVLRQAVFGIEGVVSLGVDEVGNRVEIGLEPGADEFEVRALLTRLEIPVEAVVFPRVGPAQELRGSGLELDDPHPDGMIESGWQMHVPSKGACTIGFAARSGPGSDTIFVTNDHCTQERAEYDGAFAGQPWLIDSLNWTDTIGYEIEDLDPVSCFGGFYECRESDAAIFAATVPAHIGRIAKTSDSSNCELCSPPIAIDTLNPYLEVVGRYDHMISNETLHKIGQTTGWTYGAVESTCDDVRIDGTFLYRLCSDRIDLNVELGDSGSPVFELLPHGRAELRGIIYAEDETFQDLANDAWASDLAQIEKDYGPLSVWDEPLSATIVGPDEVPSESSCQWIAQASGGFGPYSYEWLVDGFPDDTGQYLFLDDTGTSDFEISLIVTDDENDEAYDFLEVDVGSGNPCPPPQG